MPHFLILHHGFEPPSPEQMAEWNDWFDRYDDQIIARVHLPRGIEITDDGVEDLPFGPDAYTGYTLLEAEDFDAAARIAAACPRVRATRVYAVREP